MNPTRLFFTFMVLLVFTQAKSQTSHTIITLDGSSPNQYFKTLSDSTPTLGHLLSGIEAKFGSIEDNPNGFTAEEDKLTRLERSNILERVARLNRKYYALLIEKGFTPEEAMKLIVANPIVELLKIETEQKTRSISKEFQ